MGEIVISIAAEEAGIIYDSIGRKKVNRIRVFNHSLICLLQIKVIDFYREVHYDRE